MAQLSTSLSASNNNDENNHVNSSSSSNRGELKRQIEAVMSNDSHSTIATECSEEAENLTPIKVRGGALRRPAGYQVILPSIHPNSFQPELVCLIPWADGQVPEKITAMALSSAYGVLAIGTYAGMALVDIVTYTLIYSWSNTQLYGRESVNFTLPTQNSDASPSSEVGCYPKTNRPFGSS